MPSYSPNSVLAFEDFLKRAGFACQQQLDSQVFGNRLLECRSVDFVVQIVLDRSTWFIGLSELSEPGTTYYAEMLKQLLSGEQEETMPISEQIDFFRKNWPAIMALFEPEHRDHTRTRRKALGRARVPRMFPGLEEEVQ